MEKRRGGSAMRGHINRIRHGKCRTLMIMIALLSAWMVIHLTRSNLQNNTQQDLVEDNIGTDRKKVTEHIEKEAKKLQQPQTEKESTTEDNKPHKGMRKDMNKGTKRKQLKTEDISTTEVYKQDKGKRKSTPKKDTSAQQPKTYDESTTEAFMQKKKENKTPKASSMKTFKDSQSNLMKNLNAPTQEKDVIDSTTADSAADDYEEYEMREKKQKNIKKITNDETTTEFWATPASLTEEPTHAPKKLKFNKSAKTHSSGETAEKSQSGKSEKWPINKLEMELPVENKKTKTSRINKPLLNNVVAIGPGPQSDDDDTEKPVKQDLNVINKQSTERKDIVSQNTDQTVKNRSLLENVEKTNVDTSEKLNTQNHDQINGAAELKEDSKHNGMKRGETFGNKAKVNTKTDNGESAGVVKEANSGGEEEKKVMAVDPMEKEQAEILNRVRNIKQQEKSIQAKFSEISNDMDEHLNKVIHDNQ